MSTAAVILGCLVLLVLLILLVSHQRQSKLQTTRRTYVYARPPPTRSPLSSSHPPRPTRSPSHSSDPARSAMYAPPRRVQVREEGRTNAPAAHRSRLSRTGAVAPAEAFGCGFDGCRKRGISSCRTYGTRRYMGGSA